MTRRGSAGGLTFAVAVGLWLAVAGMPAGAVDATATPADDTLAGRAGTIAGQAYAVLRDQVIDPARQAGEAALGSDRLEEAYRRFAEMIGSLWTTIDEAALQPLGQAATDALNSPAVRQVCDLAGSVWGNVKAGVQRYIIGPLSGLTAPAPDGGAGGEPRHGGDAMPAALTQPLAMATQGVPGDPLEPMNRVFFAFNSSLRRQLLEPVVGAYRSTTPPAVQQSVQNFFSNLREPITIASGLLEADFNDAGNAAARFAINTTVGIAGLYDPATGYGYPRRIHNLEEALCVYRVPSGPYIVLPLYGPATLRDAIGRVATVVAYFEAMGFGIYVPYRLGDAVAQSAGSGQPSRLGQALSPDPYLTQKEAYFGASGTGCARYVRNGTDKLGP